MGVGLEKATRTLNLFAINLDQGLKIYSEK